jgi:hypothetical protein
LPQGFKNSPALFSESLARDLQSLQLEQGVLLQYMADLLVASPDPEHKLINIIMVLHYLAQCGYKLS